MSMKLTRRLFAGIAAAAPAALAKAPAGLALGREATLMSPVVQEAIPAWDGPPEPSTAVQLLWRQIGRRQEREGKLRHITTREAAGILDPEIQALTSCSPVYRMHLQMQKDERAESIIQKLRDRIEQLKKLA